MNISEIYPPISSPNYEKSFPRIYDNAKKKFSQEFSKLKEVWQKCLQLSDQNDHDEATYKEGVPYKLYENSCIISTIGGTGVATSAATALAFLNPFVLVPSIIGVIGCTILGLSPYTNQYEKLKKIRTCRDVAIQTMLKIEKCINVLNKLGELSESWEIAKKNASEENLNLLFKHLKKVQRAEIGVITDSINTLEPLLLMDNLCKESRTDQKLVSAWKDFVNEPGLKVWEDDNLQPIEIEQLKASSKTYNDFFKIRNSHSENQIERKVVLLREYVNQEFTSLAGVTDKY